MSDQIKANEDDGEPGAAQERPHHGGRLRSQHRNPSGSLGVCHCSTHQDRNGSRSELVAGCVRLEHGLRSRLLPHECGRRRLRKLRLIPLGGRRGELRSGTPRGLA